MHWTTESVQWNEGLSRCQWWTRNELQGRRRKWTCWMPVSAKFTVKSWKLLKISSLDKHRCRSGECIDHEKVCDGNVDCQDGSDEEEGICLKIHCPRGFRCRYGACVSKDARCNTIVDCADGSDEDELLCGTHYDLLLVKANATGAIPPGSCRLPARTDVRLMARVYSCKLWF